MVGLSVDVGLSGKSDLLRWGSESRLQMLLLLLLLLSLSLYETLNESLLILQGGFLGKVLSSACRRIDIHRCKCDGMRLLALLLLVSLVVLLDGS